MARRKVIVIGLDGLIPGLVRKFAQEGAMPRMARLMRSGSFSEMLPATPTDTPTNWTSIATGAWTGTHGVNSFGIHYAGESFWKPSVNGQNIFPKFPDFGSITKHALNRQCRAEYIWQRAAKEGVDCLLVNFPGAWPPNVRQHAAIVDMSGPAGHSTTRIARPARIALWGKNKHENALVAGTGNWQSIPRTWEPLAHGALPLPHSRSGGLEMLLVRRPDGFALCVSRVRNASRRICCLRPGQSSPWVRDEYDFTFDCRWHWISSYFNPDPVTLPGIFKLYLEEEDGRLFLYKSATYNPKGWASPSSIAQELIDRHLARVGHSDTVRTSLVDNDIFEPRSLEADGIADMCGHLAGRWPWRLLMTQFHAPDGLHHSMLQMVHPPAPRYLPEQEGEGWRQLREEHAVLDKFVGKVVDACADRNTVVIVVSDHGAMPTVKRVWVAKPLVDQGLLVYKKLEDGKFVVDMKRTKVIVGDHPLAQDIWVNLRGREPSGVVEPGTEYEQVREETIRVLHAIVDPENGQSPISLAIRREDAAFLGQWGDTVGDIVYFTAPDYTNPDPYSLGPWEKLPEAAITPFVHGFSGTHHSLPTARMGIFSIAATFCASGPGVRKGFLNARRNFWVVDVVPLIAHILEIPPPAHCEGRLPVEFLTR